MGSISISRPHYSYLDARSILYHSRPQQARQIAFSRRSLIRVVDRPCLDVQCNFLHMLCLELHLMSIVHKCYTLTKVWISVDKLMRPRWQLFNREVEVWNSNSSIQLPLESKLNEDNTYYNLTTNGIFFCELSIGCRNPQLVVPSISVALLWSTLILKKCKFFIWNFLKKCINTTDKC